MLFFDDFSSTLVYKSQHYVEEMAMRPTVSYIPCDTYLRGETGDIITFPHFEERSLWSETHYNAESVDKYDKDSIMPPLISLEELDAMDSSDDSDDEYMSTEMLEDICEGSKSHPIVNRREACYKIRYCIKRRQMEWKGALLSTQNMGKVYTKCLNLP